MNKAELRKIFKSKRLAVSGVEKLSDQILIQFQKIPLPQIGCLHTYLPIEEHREFDTHLITRFLMFRNPGLQIVVPKTGTGDRTLKHVIYHSELDMVLNDFGIPEPAEGEEINVSDIDLVLVPLLIYDRNGYRVGYGKGYYDQFLKDCRKDTLKIGFCYFDPVESIDDIHEYDIPLNYVVTPHTYYEF